MQLDFLELLTPTAAIIAFPPKKMAGCVADAARRVHAAGPEARQALLNEAGLLQLWYFNLGIDMDHAAHLADQFEEAVIAEVYRLRYSARRTDPLDAA